MEPDTTLEARLDALRAEVAAGRTPEELAAAVRQVAARPGWLARLLFGGSAGEVRVTRLEPAPFDGLLARARLLWVYTDRDSPRLETAVLPAGGSRGLFALAGDGLRYLTQRREHLEALLREEGTPPTGYEARALAQLLAEALGVRGNHGHDVLTGAEQLTSYAWHGLEGYELDPREWERVAARVRPPAVEEEAGGGWQLSYYSLFGWMHEKQVLLRNRVYITADMALVADEEVLSRRLFRRVPAIRY